MRSIENSRLLSDLQAAVDDIVVGQWQGDKAWDYTVNAEKDGSIAVKAAANQTIFMDTVYPGIIPRSVEFEGCPFSFQ